MQKGCIYTPSRIKVCDVKDCESMEEFLRKAIAGKEPIKATANITYNDRKDGVLPQHDIRQDRFEIAMLATDKIHATQAAKRQSMDFPVDTQTVIDNYNGGEA